MSNYNLPEKDDAPWLNCMDGFNTSSPIRPELSTGAQAVWKAYYSTNDDLAGPALAAAIRAVADQVSPTDALYARTCCEFIGERIRADLLAIAAELDSTNFNESD